MSAVDPQKKAIVQELLSRRATLSPEKAAVVDELANRFGLSGMPDFSNVMAGHSTSMPSASAARDFIKTMLTENVGGMINPFQMLVGAGKSAGELGETLGRLKPEMMRQGLQLMTGEQVPPLNPRSQMFEATNPAQSIGKGLGQVGMGAASIGAAGPALGAQVAVGAGTGALLSPESPITGAAIGGGVPVAAKGVEKLMPMAKALMSGRKAGGQKFSQVAAAAKDIPINTDAAAQQAIRADLLSKTGHDAPKVIKDYWKWEGPIDYQTGRQFANRAGRLTPEEKLTTSGEMKDVVVKLYDALKTANREAAVKAGVGNIYDDAMREYRLGSKGADIKDALVDALRKHGLKAAVGTGLGAYLIDRLSK